MKGSEQTYYVITVSRLMIGGRVFSKGDTVSLQDLGLMRSALRSGAMKPLPKGITVESQVSPFDVDDTKFNEDRTPRLR